jgi:hypothetical protein
MYPAVPALRIQSDKGRCRPFTAARRLLISIRGWTYATFYDTCPADKLVRSHLNLRFFNIRVLCVGAMLPAMFFAQTPPTAQPPAQVPTQPTPLGQDQPARPVTSPKTKPTVPDYPDPRTFTIGIFGWLTLPLNKVDLTGGAAATTYSTLDQLGKQHTTTPGVTASVPLTRTGELHFEGFLAKGDGTQDSPANTAPFSTAYNKGDFLSTQYQITALKLSYEDLLYPFKFPVSKFRLRSLWEVQYISLNGTFDAPLKPITTDSSGDIISNTISGSKAVIFPTFGVAAEYAVSPHVLLRADASAFGIPHHAEIWDAEGLVSYRRKALEFRGGFKVLHFKTSPQADEYYTDTLAGGFVGVVYHWQ